MQIEEHTKYKEQCVGKFGIEFVACKRLVVHVIP